LDRTLRIPHDYHVFDTAAQKTILFTSANNADYSFYKSRNIDIHIVDETDNKLDLEKVLNILADQYNITTLYCEGGAGVHGSLHDHGWIDQVHIYIGAKIIGGINAPGCIGGHGIELMNQATRLKIRDIRQFGEDIRLCAGIEGVAAYARSL
jgi:diaminohydroxyphosphoribosylaminopyrimidine deaminase/5-amino-6-(5-phosphoribosylamino)uracil reductase